MITIDGREYRTLPEQVEKNMKDIADLETSVSDLQDSVNNLEDDVDSLAARVYDPISSDTIVADKDEEAKTVAFSLAADLTAKIDSALQTPMATPASTILVGIDSTNAQCNVAIGEGLEIENSTLKATVTQHLYCHNITLSYRHTNATLASEGSDGAWEANFLVINNDPAPYVINHYPATDTPTIMSATNAWQLYRLYTALSIGHRRDDEPERPASGAAMHVNYSSGTYSLEKGINNDIKTKYYNFTDLDEYKRLIVVNSTLISPTRGLGGIAFELSCGHAVFNNKNIEILWDNYDDWYAGEYNKATLSDPSVTYKTYYSYQRVSCLDSVEQLL